MKFKLLGWNLIVFVSIAAVLALAKLSWLAIVIGSIAYTVTMFAVAHLYHRVWQVSDLEPAVVATPTSSLPQWTYCDFVSAMILGGATGWIIGESNK